MSGGPVPVWLDDGRGLALVDEDTGELLESATRASRLACRASRSAARREAERAAGRSARHELYVRGAAAAREALAAARAPAQRPLW